MLKVVAKTLLEVKNVSQWYQKGSGEAGSPVLDNVSMALKEGEIVGLLGRSGCGKSSLLRIVAGLARPASGSVDYNGVRVAGPVEGIAMVFQSFALFPWLSVLDNVQLGLKALNVVWTGLKARIQRSFPAGCASASVLPAPWSFIPMSS
jgi:NitT/TauT family transport system ATP-binding protein